jgi:hypothetical protein
MPYQVPFSCAYFQLYTPFFFCRELETLAALSADGFCSTILARAFLG